MERGDAARRDVGGGEVIPASRQARAALSAALAALALAAVTAAAVALRSEEPLAAVGAAALGGAAVVTLGAGLLLRAPVLVAPAAAALGAAYAVTRAVDGGVPDVQAPVVGVALLLVCELGYWAHELRTTSPDEPGAHAGRLAWLALLGIMTFVPSVALLALSDLLRVEGIAVEAAGAAAAAALIAALLVLARGQRQA